ncbi:hypothetical protein NQ156_08175 [Microbacterium sp. zg.Y625]|uniref:hypothetical protein n=1 Tax=Microbacterium jiangjiandongii TaxID=3049071 RepID=UPI00214CD1B7|nr:MULTISPECIES: hypothetical protein [unclassified Microbacterium]MCR2793031.1 hypothetical protein [Microbacterium sp. zg.Y625]MCR2814327.1 hypothetical protein [Microbacterium sp. zg.Y843]WIM24146.1 hypothetical protein QNO14_08200 [Microbacterium sp. zg-Y625]
MPSPSPRGRTAATLVLLTAVLALTACARPEVPTQTGTPAPTVGAGDTATPSPQPEPSTTPVATADPTCTSIISESTVASFEDAGLTSREEPFRIGETELPAGIQCVWADFSAPGAPPQIFGWAPLEGAAAERAQDDLLSAGWLRESGEDGLYITEDPDLALTVGADGYGMTYLFGEGWVTLSDTKQSLLLIERPQG